MQVMQEPELPKYLPFMHDWQYELLDPEHVTHGDWQG